MKASILKYLRVKAMMLLLSLFALSALAAQPENMGNPSNEDPLSEARSALARNDLAKARAVFESKTNDPAHRFAAMTGLIQVRWQEGDRDGAMKELEGMLRENPANLSLRVLKVSFLRSSSRFTEAEEEINRIARVDPDNSEMLRENGFLNYDLGRYAQAIPLLKSSLERNPGDESALAKLAKSYTHTGDHQSALNELRKLSEIFPTNIRIRVEQGRTLSRMGKFDEAANELEFAATLNPKALELRLAMGDLYGAMKNYDKAAAAYGLVVENDVNNVQAWINWIQNLDNAGQSSKAMSKGNELALLMPGNQVAVKFLVSYLEKYRQPSRISALLRNYVSINPSDSWAVNYYTQMLIKLDEHKLAKEILERAINKGVDDQNVVMSYAMSLKKQGESSKAYDTLSKYLAKHPESASDKTNFNLGLLADDSNKVDSARQHYTAVSSSSPFYVKAQINLGLLEERKGRLREALATFNAIAARPDAPKSLKNNIAMLEARIAQGQSSNDSAQRGIASEGDLNKQSKEDENENHKNSP